MSITVYSANRVTDYNFGSTAYSGGLPATWYVGLSTSTINFDGTGATEPVGNGYARQALTNNKTNFSTASNGVITNTASGVVTFAESTGFGWGLISYVGLWDNLTAGNVWWFDALNPSRTVAGLTTVIFAAGAITITFNNT